MKNFFGSLAVLCLIVSMSFAAAKTSEVRDSVGFYTACDADVQDLGALSNDGVLDFGTANWLILYEVPTSAVVFSANEGEQSSGFGNCIDEPPLATRMTLEDPIDPGRLC
jgi:hypothetical protein